MFIRYPFLLVWNLLRNLVRFPFVLLAGIFSLFSSDEPKYVRLTIQKGLPYWEKSSWLSWFQSEPTDPTMDEWRVLFQKLGRKKSVEGIVLEIQELQAGWPALDEFRTMLIQFREQGKKVVTYPRQLTTAEFYLATGSDQLLISPATPVMLNSPAFQSFFFGALLEEAGVSFDVQRIGAHKNAPENMTRSFPSPTHRGDLYELLFAFTQHMFAEMADGRDEDPDRLRQVFGWGIFSPEEALQHQLIDAIRFSDRLVQYIQTQDPTPFLYPEHPEAPVKESKVEGQKRTAARSKVEAEDEGACGSTPNDGGQPGALDPGSEDTTTQTETSEVSETTEAPVDAKAPEAPVDTKASETTDESVDVKAPDESEVVAETQSVESSVTTESSEQTADAQSSDISEPPKQVDSSNAPTPDSGPRTSDSEQSEAEAGWNEDYVVDLDDVDLDGLQWWKWTRIRKQPLVAVIPVAGTIVDESSGQSRGDQAVRPWIVAAIEEAQRNPQVKAVVLWVNSPGGSGFASEAIWWALKRLGKDKPVITYMDSYAASGGYYVACGTQKIVASPWCITGSIGVFGGKLNLERLVQRLKIGYTVVGETMGLRMMSPFRSTTDAVRQRWIEQLALFYERFLLRVSEHRDMDVEEVHEKAQGKVYLGEQAHSIGLVDEIGHLQDAVKLVCGEAEIPVPKELTWFTPSTRFRLSDLREAMRMGTGSPLWRILQHKNQPSLSQPSSLRGPDAALAQQLLTEQTVLSSLNLDSIGAVDGMAGLSGTLLQQLPIQEYLGVMQMIAGGDIAAWCDIRWK